MDDYDDTERLLDVQDESERSLSSSPALFLSFLEETLLLMPFSRFVVTVMVNEGQVQPHLMMAALIRWAEALSIVGNGECTMLTYFQSSTRVRRA